jgi:hypothetical protein
MNAVNNIYNLSDTLLQLCSANTLADLIDVIHSVVQHIFPESNGVHCFCILKEESSHILHDFYTSKKVVTKLKQDEGHPFYSKAQIEADDDLVKLQYFQRNQCIHVLRIYESLKRLGKQLVILISNGNLKAPVSDLNTILKHASACYSRVCPQLKAIPITNNDHAASRLLSGELNSANTTSIQVMLN